MSNRSGCLTVYGCTCWRRTSTTCESLSHLLRTVCIRANTCCKTTTTWRTMNRKHSNEQDVALHISIIHGCMPTSRITNSWMTGHSFPIGHSLYFDQQQAMYLVEGAGDGVRGTELIWLQVFHNCQTVVHFIIKLLHGTHNMFILAKNCFGFSLSVIVSGDDGAC